jgi:polysaccharide export outer membrane protein
MKRVYDYFVIGLLVVSCLVVFVAVALAQDNVTVRRGTGNDANIQVDVNQYLPQGGTKAQEGASTYGQFDPVKYTLGPNDVVEIEVIRHPEFSGKYGINEEGKIQYKFVGDLEVKGLTKDQLAEKLKTALAQYVVSPEISVSIVQYGSKIFYVLGEVPAPGQYVMKAESISLRDAIHLAGLPTLNASMRRCELVTPSEKGESKIQTVDLYALLYRGDLRKNIMIKPGDILYVPSTVMAKVIRIISPVTTTVGLSASIPESIAQGRTAARSLKSGSNYNQ